MRHFGDTASRATPWSVADVTERSDAVRVEALDLWMASIAGTS